MSTFFPPLPNADALIPTRRGKFIDIEVYGNVNATSGTLGDLQITGDITIAPGGSLQVEDVYSTNWDGGFDLSSGADFTATAGWLLDWGSGSSQFMGDMFIGGDVALLGSGSFATAPPGASRIVMDASGLSVFDSFDVLRSQLTLGSSGQGARFHSALAVDNDLSVGGGVDTSGGVPFVSYQPAGNKSSKAASDHLVWDFVPGDYISTGSSWKSRFSLHFTPMENYPGGPWEMIRFRGWVDDDRPGYESAGVYGVEFPAGASFLNTALFSDGTVANPGLSFTSDDTTGIYLSGAGSLRFSTNGTRRFMIHNNGWIYTGGANYSAQIRTTPGGGNVPVYTFQGSTGSGMFLNATGSGYVGLSHNANTILAGNGSNELYLGGMVAGAGSGALRYSGSQILYLASSERFKKNIEQVTFDDDDLALIDSWRSYRFRFRDSADDNVHLFTVAERVQETFGDDYVLRDDDGQVANVDDNALFTLMMETIKDLRRRVTELEGKIIGNN